MTSALFSCLTVHLYLTLFFMKLFETFKKYVKYNLNLIWSRNKSFKNCVSMIFIVKFFFLFLLCVLYFYLHVMLSVLSWFYRVRTLEFQFSGGHCSPFCHFHINTQLSFIIFDRDSRELLTIINTIIIEKYKSILLTQVRI